MKVDISALLGGDIYSLLRDRSAKAKSRFSKERDDERALKERQNCLVEAQAAISTSRRKCWRRCRRRTRSWPRPKRRGCAPRRRCSRAGAEHGGLSMLFSLTKRMLTETDPRSSAKFAYNFGVKGVRSVELHKRRLQARRVLPAVPVHLGDLELPAALPGLLGGCRRARRRRLSLDELNRIVNDAKAHGNSYFGILGGEPFLHPQLLDLFAAHPDCYFQVFTNGQLITDEVARELRAARQRLAARQHRRHRDRQRRAPRPAEGPEQDARRPRGLPPQRADHRRRHQRLPDQHRSGDRALAAPSDRDGRPLRLVPHLPRRRPEAEPELALRPEQVLEVRRFVVQMRARLPIAIVDAYWDDKGEALCPMATGVSHHISPGGDIEPCPIIQFATRDRPRRRSRSTT